LSAQAMIRIGIFGGTFNPIHLGHLAIAEEIRERLGLKKVIFVPAYAPPHKSRIKLAAAQKRFQMVKEAIKGNPFFAVSDSEIARRGKSYSVDTLRYFKKKFGKRARLYFIIGSDSLPELSKWKDIRDIFRLASFVVVNRPGFPMQHLPSEAVAVTWPGFGISSSQVRQRLAKTKSIKYLVPEKVARIIQRNRLYK
jgi:nicotinate-nucleotide adenylyltransferase